CATDAAGDDVVVGSVVQRNQSLASVGHGTSCAHRERLHIYESRGWRWTSIFSPSASKLVRVPVCASLIGQTGVGKTFLAQAAGLHACASGYSVLYTSVTAWLENLALARSSGTYLRYRDKLAKPDLIIFDDFGMRKLSSSEAQDLCEVL